MQAALKEARFLNTAMGILFAVVSVVGLFLAANAARSQLDSSVTVNVVQEL